MCLRINKCHKINNKYIPNIAETNIMVYKLLDTYDDIAMKKIFQTPYYYMPIEFDENNTFVYNQTEFQFMWEENIKNVLNGVHAYLDKYIAQRVVDEFVDTCRTKIFYAIIPKGSKYYIGIDGDIVANNLTIFKTKKSFNKFCKNNDVDKKMVY